MVLIGKYNIIWSQPSGSSSLSIISQTQGLFSIWNATRTQSISVNIDGARIYDTKAQYLIGGWFKDYRWEFTITDFTNNILNGIVKFQHPGSIPGTQTSLQGKARFTLVQLQPNVYRINKFYCDQQSYGGTTFRAYDNYGSSGASDSLRLYISQPGVEIPLQDTLKSYVQQVTNVVPAITCIQDESFPGFCIGPKNLFNESELIQKASDLKSQYDQSLTTIASLDSQYKQQTADLKQCTSDLNAQMPINDTLQTQLQTELDTQKTLENQLAQLVLQFSDIQNSNKQLADQLQTILQSITDSQTQIQAGQSSVSSLQQQQKDVQTEQQVLSSNLSSLNLQLQQLQTAYQDKQSTLSDPLLQKYVQVKGSIIVAEKQLIASRQLLEQVQDQLKTSNSLDSDLQSKRKQAIQLQNQVAGLQQSISKMQSDIKAQQSSIFKGTADILFLLLAVMLVAGLIYIMMKKQEKMTNRVSYINLSKF